MIFTEVSNATHLMFNFINLKTNLFGLGQLLDETEVVEVYSKTFLGTHLAQVLTWNCHVYSGYSELFSRIYVLRQHSKYCSTQTQVMMTA